MTEVWVAETWKAHGYDHDVHGVYDSREAAFEALKALPNMTVYVDAWGDVRGRPKRERNWGRVLGDLTLGGVLSEPEYWARARPMVVLSREAVTQAP